MLFKKTLLASALLALGGFAVSAGAATTQTGPSFLVKIHLDNACDVSGMTATDMDMGSHTFLDGTVNGTSTIKVKCTQGNIFKIGLDAGSNAATANDTTTRRMKDASGNYIAYDLTQTLNGAHWGDTSTDSVQETGTGLEESYTVYGAATLTGKEPAGDYSDTVTTTITF